ncbi:MAG: hypothetical protein A2Y17_02125 [Clostridiales bacterium GWF2_38_85]|nr:MAG: hypothetical protein A2Y17_02125 [Clostridiales bacterium GWF2_38_85]HBL85121.1 RNA polymerase subunit sigma-70 [Clostridiales bacterium]
MFNIIMSMLSQLYFLFLRVSGSYSFPAPLTREEESEYFDKYKKGDMEARAKLIEHNLRLVAHIVKKYYTTSKDQDDLISIGTIGLIKAIDSFNPDNGTRFATYAGKCLQNEILMHFRTQKRLNCETSIDDAVDIDKDGNPLTYMDVICFEDDIVEQLDLKFKSELVSKAMKEKLNDRERNIIIMRHGLCTNGKVYTQREVAKIMKISRSYVSRLEKGALNKMHQYIINSESKKQYKTKK